MIAGPAHESWTNSIQRASRLAYGADISIMEPQPRFTLSDLRHPLSGQPLDLPQPTGITSLLESQARQALLEEFDKLAVFRNEPVAAFMALWCFLPRSLKSRRGLNELGSLWNWLPAETRMPNHPLLVHQSLTSALASILKEGHEPMLLSFTIGPVQRFIATARRTSDLWGGSALLSAAVLEGLAPLVSRIGPDHVLFPNLRRSNLFLRWLLQDSLWKDSLRHLDVLCGHDETTAGGLPNRFLAVVPSAEAGSIAKECEGSVRDWWRSMVSKAAQILEARVPKLQGYGSMAGEQADASIQVFWAVSPWPAVDTIEHDDGFGRRAAWMKACRLPRAAARLIEEASDRPISGFKPNGGVLYAAAYESVEALLGSVKLTRCPSTRIEDGLKCSLCGERGVFPGPISFEEQKETWRNATSDLRAKGDLRRGEALCGVCWAKRQFGRENQSIPSTAEIAASPFKMKVLHSYSQLEPEVSALVSALKAKAPDFLNAFVVPVIIEEKRRGGLRGAFAGVSGEILLGHPREREELEEETGVAIQEPVLDCVRNLRRAASKIGISPPRPYLAVVAMDGDSMGRWLSGENNRKLKEYLCERAVAELSHHGAEGYLDITWPMTPAMHGAFSEACAIFSQRTAPHTLHEEALPAFMVYAGGDDVLAMSPIGCHDPQQVAELATQAAFNLRMRFSGHVMPTQMNDTPDPARQSGFVVDPKDGISLAFGRLATASVGIAVFHHKWPLSRALAEARRAEEYAKEELGRDALAISILRRSGQITLTGLKFFTDREQCPIPSFHILCHSFAFDYLSPRFLSELKARLAPLHGGLAGNELLNLVQPIVIQALGNHCLNGDKFELLKQAVVDLSVAAALPTGTRNESAAEIPEDLRHLRRWIELIETAAFLGRGEEP
jgi:CRISPR-associated protein Cmr2